MIGNGKSNEDDDQEQPGGAFIIYANLMASSLVSRITQRLLDIYKNILFIGYPSP
jgi:hypothetical protein